MADPELLAIPAAGEDAHPAKSLAPARLPTSEIAPSSSPKADILSLWLHGRSPHTQAAYRSDAMRLFAFCRKPLDEITLADVQAFADSLTGAEASRYRTLSAVKSLFTFAHRLGYCAF